MSQQTHEDNIDATLRLESAPMTRAGLGTTLFMAVDPFTSSGAFAGNRTAEFSDSDALQNAVDNGDLAHEYFSDLADSLGSQTEEPFPFKIGAVKYDGGNGADYDASNPEDLYANAYQAIKAADADFYGVTLDISRDSTTFINTDTDGDTTDETADGDQFIYQLAKTVETDRRILSVQTANGDWLTNGVPSNLLGDSSGTGVIVEGLERTGFTYHDSTFNGDSTTELPPGSSSDTRAFLATTWLARFLSFDPDEQSAPADLPVDGVPLISQNLTGSERQNAIDNGANIGLPYGPAPHFVDPGQNAQGRALYEMITADWFYFRLTEDMAKKKVEYSDRGEKIPVSPVGQGIMRSVVSRRLSQGVRNGHFLAAEDGPEEYTGPSISFPEITDSDKQNQRLRCDVSGRFEVSARKFQFTIEFTR